MTIAFGSTGTSAAGTTSVAPLTPAAVNAGELLVLLVVNKYPAAPPSTPSGWTFAGAGVAQTSGGSGASGVDTGQVLVTIFTRIADGTEDAATITVTITGGNSARGIIYSFTKDPTKDWGLAYAVGQQGTATVNWSVAMGSDPGIAAGDFVLAVSGINGDAGASASQALAATGLTFGAVTERNDEGTSLGDDCRMSSATAAVTAGTASSVVTLTQTISTSTNADHPAGAVVLLRMREVVAGSNIDPSGIATAEAFGTASLLTTINVGGIASAEAFGTASFLAALDVGGIASAEAFGIVAILAAVDVGGIASAEAFGACRVLRDVSLPAVSDFSSTLELDFLDDGGLNMYVIKQGDRLPGIAGRLTIPFGIDLTDVPLYLTYKGRTVAARTIAVTNDGLADDSPAIDNADELPTVWDWHHYWEAGQTDDADRYQVGISAQIDGAGLTIPNDGWGEFVIQAQLV